MSRNLALALSLSQLVPVVAGAEEPKSPFIQASRADVQEVLGAIARALLHCQGVASVLRREGRDSFGQTQAEAERFEAPLSPRHPRRISLDSSKGPRIAITSCHGRGGSMSSVQIDPDGSLFIGPNAPSSFLSVLPNIPPDRGCFRPKDGRAIAFDAADCEAMCERAWEAIHQTASAQASVDFASRRPDRRRGR